MIEAGFDLLTMLKNRVNMSIIKPELVALKSIRARIFLCGLGFLANFSVGCGQSLLVTGAPGGGPTFSDTVGYQFTVGSAPLLITQVGVLDTLGDGLLWDNQIGIWTSSGSEVLSVTIPAGTTAALSSGFRWVTLATPVTLLANLTYNAGSQSLGEGRYSGMISFSDDVSLVGVVRNNQPWVYSFPDAIGVAGQAVVGPNFVYTAIPEPSSLGLVAGVALFILLALRRRRKVES